ncbi:unnamed protein product [Polarella glacialis]|uniref:Uncharacterized protein n=1 Tax=Polarella glacialis TaxID=89957 RepID=A0A813JCH8_POLGL|nr:unnamed protein product [Polarella glacialis]CAE8675458.1 unnamed protein product [Polarella glacialis]
MSCVQARVRVRMVCAGLLCFISWITSAFKLHGTDQNYNASRNAEEVAAPAKPGKMGMEQLGIASLPWLQMSTELEFFSSDPAVSDALAVNTISSDPAVAEMLAAKMQPVPENSSHLALDIMCALPPLPGGLKESGLRSIFIKEEPCW